MKCYETEDKKNEKKEKELFYQKLGEQVFRYRKAVPMSQAELSDTIGVSKATISGIENGQPTETYNTHLLAKALGKPISSLMYGELEFQQDYIYELLQEIFQLPLEHQKVIFSMLENMI